MATSSTGISSTGIGSGLDVKSIISSLMSIERKPLEQMQTDATKLNAKLSSYGKLQSYVSALGDAADKLAKADTWSQTTVSASSDTALSATSSAQAAAGSYSVQVTALASTQALASAAYADPAGAAGMSGSLSIELGAWDAGQTGFTPTNYPSFVDVAISSSDSLENIRDKINASAAGVTASIVTDSTGSRLIVRSKATGAENGFRITVTDDDGNGADASGLSALGYDPSAGVTSMTRTKAASDAAAVVDGLAVTSKTNDFTGIIAGVSFTAKSVTSTAVDLTVTNDAEGMRADVEAFVTAYNDLAKFMAAQTKYDSATETAGTLQGDSASNALRSAMRSLGSASSGSSSVFARLAQIGLDPQSDGTLKIDSSKLDAAVAKPDEMMKLFGAGDTGTDADDGFASRIAAWADDLLDFDGAVTTRQESLQKQLTANSRRQSDFEDRLTSVEARLTSQYTALDTQMAKMSALSTYITQQIAAWNSTSSSS